MLPCYIGITNKHIQIARDSLLNNQDSTESSSFCVFFRGSVFFSAKHFECSEFMSRHIYAHESTTLVDVVCILKANIYYRL